MFNFSYSAVLKSKEIESHNLNAAFQKFGFIFSGYK